MKEIIIGAALSNANTTDLVYGKKIPENILWYIEEYLKNINNFFFAEFQPEFIDGWVQYNSDRKKFELKPHINWYFIKNTKIDRYLEKGLYGVHMPIINIDVLSDDEFWKKQSIANIKASMDYAHYVQAHYVVFHLTQKDKWQNVYDRRKIWENESLKIYQHFADYYRKKGFKFVPLVENLEYPKFPSTPLEMKEIFNVCKELLPETKVCFDVSHLWRSRGLIFETVKNNQGEFANILNSKYFIDVMDETLEYFSGEDIYLWHFGGCYGTETHLMPGLYPKENPNSEEDFRLDRPNSFFDEYAEINCNQVLRRIIGFCKRYNQPIKIILEIHKHNFYNILLSIKAMKKAIENKLERGDWQDE